ncbi:MAG: Ig-like domain-containing protein [Steroidobacteraceae bacterium]
MMKKLVSLALFWTSVLIAGCGGGSGTDAFTTPNAAGNNATVATVAVTTSKVSILSDGSETADIKVFVRDANNVLLKGVPVTLSANNGGSLSVPSPAQTGDDGTLTATLGTPGNNTLRTITVTATAGGVNGTVNVQVISAAPPTTAGSLTVTTSSPTIPSDGSLPATITAIVRDTSNRFLSAIPVTFTASSGGVAVTQGTTNASGVATATVSSASDPTNRAITVTATAQALTQTVTLNVTGTRLSIQGANALVLGANSTYTVTLIDSGDHGIAGRTITVTSARNNTLSATSLTTDTTGRATFTMTVANAGNDTLTVSGLGLTAAQAVSVNADSFTFTTPAANAEAALNTPTTLTVRWLTNGAPNVGQPVTFNTTRGTITGSPATTNASGDATVTISSPTAGFANVTAQASGTATAALPVEFVATTPTSIDVQPNVFTVAPNEQATLTAVVRDASGNLVKNQTVTFSLTDNTGGTLSVASAVTNSQGRASSVYTAGSTVSARDGVVVTARVGALSDTVNLTVANKEVFISLGTGNSIDEPNTAQYRMQFTIAVTDANGNGVAGVPLTVSVLTQRYLKGNRAWNGTSYAGYAAPVYTCIDEDSLVPATARNGVLDPGEDFNNNGRIDIGNIALVTPRSVTTDSTGIALVDVLYPQDAAYWVEVSLEARASVQGTEFVRSTTFLLPGSTADFTNQQVSPPGPRSPYGVNPCATPN